MPESYTDAPMLTGRFDRALAYALDHHRRQLRKGGEVPYFSHLMAVSGLVLEMGGDEDEAIAGLLHDVVEDGGGTVALAEIETAFGERVAGIVKACSDSEEEVKAPWLARKQAYIGAIPAKDAGALRVSLADKLHNARTIRTEHRRIGEAVFDRFRTGSGTAVRWYYRELARAFRAREDRLSEGDLAALAELEEIVAELDAAPRPGTS